MLFVILFGYSRLSARRLGNVLKLSGGRTPLSGQNLSGSERSMNSYIHRMLPSRSENSSRIFLRELEGPWPLHGFY
jgi:hypothetical protein